MRHSAGPRSGKLRLDLLHERLHGRQGAMMRLRGGLKHDVCNPDRLEGTEGIHDSPDAAAHRQTAVASALCFDLDPAALWSSWAGATWRF